MVDRGFPRTSMGDKELAQKGPEKALSMGRHLGDNRMTAKALIGIAQLDNARSDLKDVSTNAEAALSLAEAMGITEIQVQARRILALVQAEQRSVENALASAFGASQLARENAHGDLGAGLGYWASCEHTRTRRPSSRTVS